VGKEAAMEAEVRAAKERQLVPLETRMAQFRDLVKIFYYFLYLIIIIVNYMY
jgi:hypothetical protein